MHNKKSSCTAKKVAAQQKRVKQKESTGKAAVFVTNRSDDKSNILTGGRPGERARGERAGKTPTG